MTRRDRRRHHAASAPRAQQAEPATVMDALAGQPTFQATPALDAGEVSELDTQDFAGDVGDGFAPDYDAETDAADATEAAEPVGRSLRGFRRLMVAIVVAVLLLCAAVAVDGVARLQAERTIATRLQSQLGSSAQAHVMIGGTPFLAQAALHQYPEVKVTATNATFDGFTFSTLDADCTNVKTTQDNKSGTIASLTGDAVITYDSIAAKQGVPIQYISSAQLQFTYTGKVLGFDVQVVVVGQPVLDAAAQSVSLSNIQTKVAGVGLPDVVTQLAAQLLIKPVPLAMPAGVTVTGLKLLPEGLDATVTGSNLDLAEFQ